MFLKSRFPLKDCFQLPFFRMTCTGIRVFQIYAGKKRHDKHAAASRIAYSEAHICIGNVRSGA